MRLENRPFPRTCGSPSSTPGWGPFASLLPEGKGVKLQDSPPGTRLRQRGAGETQKEWSPGQPGPVARGASQRAPSGACGGREAARPDARVGLGGRCCSGRHRERLPALGYCVLRGQLSSELGSQDCGGVRGETACGEPARSGAERRAGAAQSPAPQSPAPPASPAVGVTRARQWVAQ